MEHTVTLGLLEGFAQFTGPLVVGLLGFCSLDFAFQCLGFFQLANFCMLLARSFLFE